MAVSTIPAFKAALYTAISSDASVTADKIQVSYGAPIRGHGSEFIALGDVSGEQDWANIGIHLKRDELYELDLYVLVNRQGGDQQACTERAFTIAGYIENLLRADPTVSQAVIYAGFGGKVELTEGASDQARSAVLKVGVKARARI